MPQIPFLKADLLRLHQLIKTKSAGSPKALAKKLNCSVSSVHNKIKELREMGLPIMYCEFAGYHYTKDVKINFSISIDDNILKQITGGKGCLTNKSQNNFATPVFLECDGRNLLQNSTTAYAHAVAAVASLLPKKL